MLQPYLFIQNADLCKSAERLFGVVDLAVEEKLSSHRCSMTSGKECYSLLLTNSMKCEMLLFGSKWYVQAFTGLHNTY